MKQSKPEKDDAEYIPVHLRHYVFHSQEDFYVSRHFDPLLLSHLMYEGFLPIASEYCGECFLLPKLHRKRCILVVDTPEHVPKSVKKRGKKYKLALNQAFDAVVKGCHAQHGISWLYPPIVEGFRKLFEAGEHGIEIYPGRHVRFYSVELVDVETNAVVAGELGYTVGKTYTSLTGFSRVSGAGTVQLHALGRLLYLSGFQVWDLGMSMPYKLSLGAEDVDRDIFLEHLYRWRPYDCLLALQEAPLMKTGGGVHVKALFEISRPPRAISGIEKDANEALKEKELHSRQTSSSSAPSNEEGDAEAEGKRNASMSSSGRGSTEHKRNSRHSNSTGGDKSDDE
uniref:Leucyl/phenylalanyl-tRNA--protein transferase n=1 Tax=Globisporangium ultimum (strain ATCC 200006 / CBS 805.95 / DAOM BR144) TaxID=431595 RepID=K3X1Z7_GLOUD